MSHLFWGGVDCVELARTFGTPLYVLDESIIRSRCAEIRIDFLGKWPGTTACYASKAFLTRAMARIIDQEGLGLDVVSGGELYTALSANFPASRIELHGSAKSAEELKMALGSGVGRIVVDGPMELALLADLASGLGYSADILLRVAPGVRPDTHAHIVTGQAGSKFGFPLEGPMLSEAVSSAMNSASLALKGLHFHIGSQIHEPESHVEAVLRLVECLDVLRRDTGFMPEELNFGGGFGVRMSPGDSHLPLRAFTDAMMEALTRECGRRDWQRPHVSIEPGRWVVSDAGLTLYSVETVKPLENVTYVGVDGGMADNLRPALYQAKYEAALAARPEARGTGGTRLSIAGKCCETGDILIEAADLPVPEQGEILAVYGTGAYTFSMASNYNRLPRPAVVLVKDGCAELIVERQTFEDLLRGDLIPQCLS